MTTPTISRSSVCSSIRSVMSVPMRATRTPVGRLCVGGGRRPGRGSRRRRTGGAGARRAAKHPGGGQRPAGATLHPRRALRGRLRPARDRRNAEPAAHHPDREAAAGAARPGAARSRRHRADAAGPRARRPAGHLRLQLRPRRDRREGARVGPGRLHRQALLADRGSWPGSGRPSGAARSPSRSWPGPSPSTTGGAG